MASAQLDSQGGFPVSLETSIQADITIISYDNSSGNSSGNSYDNSSGNSYDKKKAGRT